MATKNIKKLSYDLDALMEDFKSSLGISFEESKELETLTTECANLEAKIEELNSKIREIALPKNTTVSQEILSVDDLKEEREIIEKFQITLKEMEDYVKFTESISDKDRETLTYQEKLQLKEFISKRNAMFTEFKNLIEYFGTTNYYELIEKANERILELDNIDELKQTLENTETEYKTKIARKQVLENKTKTGFESTVENFKFYLEDKGFSTEHAEELFLHHQDPTKNPLILAESTFQMRKRHPKRDAFIKKFIIPTAITAFGFCITAASIAAAGLVDGTSILGIIPISQVPGLTALATGVVAGAIGVIATPLVIIAKDAITKAHYKLWYKDAFENLSDYESGTSIDNLHIAKLIERIQATKRKILEMSQGNWFTKALKFLPKHFLNVINRNRIHHLEAYTKDLMEIYAERESAEAFNDAKKAETLKPVYELLKQVEDFIGKDVYESKVYTMLTCSQTGEHTHKSTIENIDIFANLKMYVEAVAQKTTKQEIKEGKKQAYSMSKNLNEKTAQAAKVVNGDRLITRMLSYNEKYARFVESKTANEYNVVASAASADGKTISVIFDDGNSMTLSSSEVTSFEDITRVKLGRSKTTVYYQNGSVVEILKPKKVVPELETARRIIWDKLSNDQSFIDEVKTEGFKQSTINSLIKQLEKYINKETDRLSFGAKSPMGRLYSYTMQRINEETVITCD